MPNIGVPELVIILVIALLVLGPGRLPDVASSLGKSIREFRKAASDVQESASLTPPAAAPVAPAAAAAPVTPAASTEPVVTAPAEPAAPAADQAASVPVAPADPGPLAAPAAPPAADVVPAAAEVVESASVTAGTETQP